MKRNKLKAAIGIVLMVAFGLATIYFGDMNVDVAAANAMQKAQSEIETLEKARKKTYNVFSVPVDTSDVIWTESFNRNNFIHKATLGYHRFPEAMSESDFDRLFSYAKQFLGIQYCPAGQSPSTGFDCGGFVQYVFNSCGINLTSASCEGQYSLCDILPQGLERPGDIVFFKGTGIDPDSEAMTHVGIYIGDGKMIHSSSNRGVVCSSLSDEYWIEHEATFGRPY